MSDSGIYSLDVFGNEGRCQLGATRMQRLRITFTHNRSAVSIGGTDYCTNNNNEEELINYYYSFAVFFPVVFCWVHGLTFIS